MVDKPTPASAAPAAAPSANSKVVAGVIATGAAWWEKFVQEAKSVLETVGPEVVKVIEPLAATAFSNGISELEKLALNALTQHPTISTMIGGPEKVEAAIIEVADKFQKQTGETPVAVEVQQAVANAQDALGLAKAHLS